MRKILFGVRTQRELYLKLVIINFDAFEKSLVINHNFDSGSHHYQMNLNLN